MADRYTNPILHADYSDPDVIRVGSDYWMVASSFQVSPGLPVLHSTDLVHWRLVNHVIPRLPWPGYDRVAHGRGVWAPSIRFHDGEYLVFFGAPDEGLFVCRTKDPCGPWSAPHCIKQTVGWIDPCPFWDEDGQAYLVNAFAKSRVGFKSVLRLNHLTPEGNEVLEGRFVFEGLDSHPTIEGPKLYRREGWYYLFAPAGGVATGWQTVLRSRSLWGSWEDRVVLHQGSTDVNGPHQGALVDTEWGDSWFLHFQDKGPFGRIVHLQPVEWVDGWPRVGRAEGEGPGEPVAEHAAPRTSRPGRSFPDRGDDFAGPDLDRGWQWQAVPPEGAWNIPAPHRFWLKAFPCEAGTDVGDLPHTLARKFPAPPFTAEVEVRLLGGLGDRAGLAVVGAVSAALALERQADGVHLVFLEGGSVRDLGRWTEERTGLKLEVDEQAVCRFRAGSVEAPAFTARAGVWVGAKVGLFCTGGGAGAEFGPFRIS